MEDQTTHFKFWKMKMNRIIFESEGQEHIFRLCMKVKKSNLILSASLLVNLGVMDISRYEKAIHIY